LLHGVVFKIIQLDIVSFSLCFDINFVTVPGTWLFLLANAGLFLILENKRKKVSILLLFISILILVYGQLIIVPTVKKVSSLAVKQYQTSTFIQDFTSKKTVEDTLGGVNLLFLLFYLLIYILDKSKSVESKTGSR